MTAQELELGTFDIENKATVPPHISIGETVDTDRCDYSTQWHCAEGKHHDVRAHRRGVSHTGMERKPPNQSQWIRKG